MTKGLGRPHLSVVIPTADDQERLDRSLPRVADYLRKESIDAEILVVDDASADGTVATAERFLQGRRGRVLRQAERGGRGRAVRTGLLEAEGRWALIVDAGLSVPIEEHAGLAASARDYDLDLAAAVRGGEAGKLQRLVAGVSRSVLQFSYRDPLCDFKLLDRERIRPLVERMAADRVLFDAELLFVCQRLRLKVRDFPIRGGAGDRPRVGLIADLPRTLIELVRIRWRYRRGMYHPEIRGDGGARGRDG